MQKFEYVEAKVFEKATANGTVLVIVHKSNHFPFPRYRTEIGTEQVLDGDKRRFFPTVSPRIENQKMCQPTMDGSLSGLIGLLNEAEKWIHEDACYESNRVQTEKESRELAQVNRGKPQVRTTGKTAARKEKVKRIMTEFKAA